MKRMQRWTGTREWEEIRLLGSGGQSKVYLVRNTARIQEREGLAATIAALSHARGGFSQADASEFANLLSAYGRTEAFSELGALKVYNPRAAGAELEQQALKRLNVEIDILGKEVPGLPRLLDHNEDAHWAVTEFCPGGTLESNLLRYKGEPLLSLSVLRRVTATVALLHEKRIFHRDIKPANVFFREGEEPVLGDLGIALPLDAPARLTFTNESVGPWDFRPPWADKGGQTDEIDGSFDVYLLGKLLWCMVSGRLKLNREWYDRPEYNLTMLYPDNPQMHAINAILGRCLQDSPEKCLPNAGELLSVVDAHLSAMQRGGQLLRAEVPRPCRVCGLGFYHPSAEWPNQPGQALSFHWVTPKEAGRYSQPYGNEGTVFAQFFICDKCGHLQLFKLR